MPIGYGCLVIVELNNQTKGEPMEATAQLIKQLTAIAGQARFVSFTYTDKKHGEIARRVMIIGADYMEIIRKSKLELELIVAGEPLTALQAEAASELLESFNATLNGTQMGYTKQGVYLKLCNGISYNTNDGTLELCGLEHSKVVIQAGVYKQVNSRPLTLAKAELRKRCPVSKYKTLCLDAGHWQGAKLNGETIELQ